MSMSVMQVPQLLDLSFISLVAVIIGLLFLSWLAKCNSAELFSLSFTARFCIHAASASMRRYVGVLACSGRAAEHGTA